MKGEGKNCELAECAMRRGVSVRAYGGADEETVDDMVGEGTGVFSKKVGRKKKKEGAFRKKVHRFSFDHSLFTKIEIFFSQNLRLFETKSLLLRLIKHNFPFPPPHCGVYIAQSRGTFPHHPAQTLFDLLNLRDFALSRPIRTGQKALSLNMGWHLHDSNATLLVCMKTRGKGIYLTVPLRRIVCRRYPPDHSHTQEHEELADPSTR